MSPLSITKQQARSFVVSRQGLCRPSTEPEEVVRHLGGVQTQYALSLPAAVACRCKAVNGTWQHSAFNSGPSLFKTWSLRSTLHAHPIEDFALWCAFSKPRYANFARWNERLGFDGNALRGREERVLEALAEGPLSRQALHARVPELKVLEWAGWGADVKGLAFLGKIVVAPSGPGPTMFALSSQWLGPSVERMDHEEAMTNLLRRYLRTHGPATIKDFAYWTGTYQRSAIDACKRLRGEIETISVDGWPGERLALREDLESLQHAPPVSGIRLLAKFDPLVMAHFDKSLVIEPKWKQRIIRPAGQVEAVMLVDGRAAGTWRLARSGTRARFVVSPFMRVSKQKLQALEREAIKAGRALGLKSVDLAVEDPKP